MNVFLRKLLVLQWVSVAPNKYMLQPSIFFYGILSLNFYCNKCIEPVSVLGSRTFLCLNPNPQGVWMDRQTDRQTVKSHIVSTLLRICMGDGSFQDAFWGCRAQCSFHHKKETKQRFKIFLSFLHIVHHLMSLHCSPYCCTVSS